MIQKLMLGTVQFGLKYGVANTGGQTPYREVVDILATAHENGLVNLDTAASYGESEVVLGKAMAELALPEKFKVISKVAPFAPEIQTDAEAEKAIEKSILASLEKLKIKQLYGCLFHRENEERFLPALEKFVARGLIAHFGISIDTKMAAVTHPCEMIQLPFNLLDTRFESIIAAGKSKIFSRSAYLQGLLLMSEEKVPTHLREILPIRRSFQAIAAQHGIEWSEFCLRYPLSRPDINKVLIGVDTLAQLKANLSIAAQGPLPAQVMTKIAAARVDLSEQLIRPTNWNR